MLNANTIIQKALIRAFPQQSEAAKGLYKLELASWLREAEVALAKAMIARYLLNRNDQSFRAWLRSYTLSLGLRDYLLTWAGQQSWDAARGWNWSGQGENAASIVVDQSDTESTLKGALNSCIAANELLQPAQANAPVVNNAIEFAWDEWKPVALALFPATATISPKYDDVNALCTVLVEAPGALSVWHRGDQLVNPDQTITLQKGNRIRTVFDAVGEVRVDVYGEADVLLGSYPVRRWVPSLPGDGATVTYAATTPEWTNARMVAVALASPTATPPSLQHWQAIQQQGQSLVIEFPRTVTVGDYLLAALALAQQHRVTAMSTNRGTITPTIEGIWTEGGTFAAQDVTIELMSTSQFRWKRATDVTWTTANLATTHTALGATGLSVRWTVAFAEAEEVGNVWEVWPFTLRAPSGWTLLQASASADNFINVVYGRLLSAQDRECKFRANEEVTANLTFAAYRGVNDLAPVAASVKAHTLAATTHNVSFVTAPTTSQTVALFFANADGVRFQQDAFDLSPLRIYEPVVPVMQFGDDGARVKNVRMALYETTAVPLPRDFPLLTESLYQVGNVCWENGRPLTWMGGSATRQLPRVAGQWGFALENDRLRLQPAIQTDSPAAPPSPRIVITGVVALSCLQIEAAYENELIELLVQIARERAALRVIKK